MTIFKTIWNCRDHFETKSLSRTSCHILKRYLKLLWEKTTAHASASSGCGSEVGHAPAILEFLKIRTVIRAFWRYLKRYFENSDTNFEHKDDKWCILPLFGTMVWPAKKMLKAVKLNGAIWRFLRPMLDDCPPRPLLDALMGTLTWHSWINYMNYCITK